MTTALSPPTHDLLSWFTRQMRAPRLRTMREFAEQEIMLPDGPYRGQRLNMTRQPYAKLGLDAIDSGQWRRIAAVGPTQSGKTLTFFLIPLMYHLFEIEETVICGLPNLDMADDKWREDILPVIMASRFRDLLPRRGSGSRGGKVGASIQFQNGATLRFMTGGAGDKGVAGFTSRIIVITEVDGMDESGGTSREADRVTQLLARTRAWGSKDAIVYLECTASIPEGRIWREYQEGTESKIATKCPLCMKYVTLGRDNLVGWQGAETIVDAREVAAFACSVCGVQWSEADRAQACRDSVLVHRGQAVDETGAVIGALPRTDTLGFRWSAVDNLFASAGDVAVDEWRGVRAQNEENAERELCQFVWARPYEGDMAGIVTLDADAVLVRTTGLARGQVPDAAEFITVGVDLGKFLCHWTAVAWSPGATPHVIDYGRLEVASADLGTERALLVALEEFHDMTVPGWPTADGGAMIPAHVWTDSGWLPDVVYGFCRLPEHRGWLPAKGFGASQDMAGVYRAPKARGGTVKAVGDGYHISLLKAQRTMLAEIDVDRWKSFVHDRLMTPITEPAAMTLHSVPKVLDHLQFAKHITSERSFQEFVAGKGYVTRWERVYKQNHWLDALMLACAAGHFAGARLTGAAPIAPLPKPNRRNRGIATPDGRAFVVSDRT